MKRHIAGFIILHIIGAAGFYVAWRAGVLVPFYAQDKTGLVAFITAFALIGSVCVAFRQWDDVALIGRILPILGLGGTVVGLSMAIEGLSVDFDITLLGLHTAFNTTLAGIVGHLFFIANVRVLK